MSGTPKLVTIFGGSGFVGRYIAQRMAKQGWRVRVAVRRPNEAHYVRPYGVVGQVEPVLANIRDDASVHAACEGADAVVNCVGTFDARGLNNFDAIHEEGAGRIAKMAKATGAKTLVHISAIGADEEADSLYGRSKGAGEAAVLAAYKSAVILRPSVIFGAEDAFFNRFARMVKMSPILPLVGSDTLFQPVYVDDVAAAAEQAVLGNARAGIYELGGPDVESFGALMDRMMNVIRYDRIKINLPFFAATMQAKMLNILQFLTGGLFKNNILTPDQVTSLKSDNIVAASGVKTFKDLGIKPRAMGAILEDYLYCHRPYGQYTELTESGKNLRA